MCAHYSAIRNVYLQKLAYHLIYGRGSTFRWTLYPPTHEWRRRRGALKCQQAIWNRRTELVLCN